ncbi:MAG TPA: right-handed parallel beta-helix repeat-containing protein [Polyangiaceae bacterium]|nr:right-handed parallel beta-helix repeat-containing protein [Polyangiaceae bacterium]
MNTSFNSFARAFAAATLAIALLPGTAQATEGILQSTGSMTLTEDHFGTIFLFQANGTLDCQNHTIYNSTQEGICGDNFDEQCGVLVLASPDVHIVNCRVRYFGIGMHVQSSNNVMIQSSDIRENFQGIRMRWVNNNAGHFFRDNYVGFNNEEGADIDDSSGLQFLGNSQFRYNGRDGLDCGNSTVKILSGNAFRNKFNGYELDGCNGSILSNVLAQSNGNTGISGEVRSGISLDATQNFVISNSVVNSNYRDGIRVANGSNNGRIEANSGAGNGEHDAHQTSSVGNTWIGNVFGTTAGF